MAPLFLIHEDAAGSRTVNQVSQTEQSRRYWLPNEFSDNFELLAASADTHSGICLDLSHDHVLLSVWNDSSNTSIISPDGREFLVPVSTELQQKSFILRHDDQFISPAGRWNLQYDDEHRTISNSMRPPQILSDDGHGIPSELEFEELPPSFAGNTPVKSTNPSPRAKPGRIDEITSPSNESIRVSTSNEVLAKPGINGSPTEEDVNSRPTSESHAHLQSEHRNVTSLNDLTPQNHRQHDMPVDLTERASTYERRPKTTQPQAAAVGADSSAPPVTQREDIHSLETATPSEVDNESSKDSQTSLATASNKRKTSTQETRQNGARHKRVRAISTSVEPGEVENDEQASMVDKTIQEILTEGQQHNVSVTSSSKKSSTACTTIPKNGGLKPRNMPNKASSNEDLDSITFTPSSRTRAASHTSSSPAKSLQLDGPLSIVFSSNTSIQKKKNAMTMLRDLGCGVVKSVNEANILCVADCPLKRTSKFVIAIATGKIIVTEKWIVECQRQRKFPDPARFLPKDPEAEQKWGFQLVEAIERGRRPDSGLTSLLSGWIIYLTPSLKRDLAGLSTELGEIALVLGAESFFQKLPSKSSGNRNNSLVLGIAGDTHAAAVGRMGFPLYSKDLLTMAPLRGYLELDSSEFRLHTPVKEEEVDD